MQIDDYLKAGKIAAEVRENVRKKNWIGSTLEEICEQVESEIIQGVEQNVHFLLTQV